MVSEASNGTDCKYFSHSSFVSVALNVCYDCCKILKPILKVCVKKHVLNVSFFVGPFCVISFVPKYRLLLFCFFLLDPVLQFLLSNIQDSKLSSVSASAIESLCMSCYLQMTKYFDVLAQVKNW